jgi:catechol 2,3-dioxygenase-like lactoylglutathione lyase family enzyme
VTHLHHVGLTVGDLEASIDFYCALLDAVVKERSTSSGPEIETLTGLPGASLLTADLELRDGAIVELIQYVSPPAAKLVQRRNQPGHTHVGFAVDDIDAIHARLAARDSSPPARPIVINEPGSAWHGARVMYVDDPDGRTVELVSVTPLAQPASTA